MKPISCNTICFNKQNPYQIRWLLTEIKKLWLCLQKKYCGESVGNVGVRGGVGVVDGIGGSSWGIGGCGGVGVVVVWDGECW